MTGVNQTIMMALAVEQASAELAAN